MKRIDEIRNLFLTRRELSVQQLCSYYKVSAVSIRKDLNRLEEKGLIRRTHGGAVLAEESGARPRTSALSFDHPVLYRLAERACGFIRDGDILFLGSGRTCCILAKMLHKFSGLSVVTNNITALDDLLTSGARIYLIGGEVTSTDGKTLFASPEDSSGFSMNIRVNKAFTSISGIDIGKGLTVNSIISTYMYHYLPSISQKWYMMASSDKFNRLAMYSAADLADVDCLITDGYPPEYETVFAEKRVEVAISDQTAETVAEGETGDTPFD